MDGSPSAIISLGLGSWGSPGLMVTLGLGQGDAVQPSATASWAYVIFAGHKGHVAFAGNKGRVKFAGNKGHVMSNDQP